MATATTIDTIAHNELMRLLTDIGFMGITTGNTQAAAVIFQGVHEARPTQIAPFIGKALLALTHQDFPQSLEWLRQGAAIAPNNAMLEAFTGLCLLMAGRTSEAEQDLVQALHGNDPDAGALAQNLLATYFGHCSEKHSEV